MIIGAIAAAVVLAVIIVAVAVGTTGQCIYIYIYIYWLIWGVARVARLYLLRMCYKSAVVVVSGLNLF